MEGARPWWQSHTCMHVHTQAVHHLWRTKFPVVCASVMDGNTDEEFDELDPDTMFDSGSYYLSTSDAIVCYPQLH